MENLARVTKFSPVVEQYGHIIDAERERYRVESDSGTVEAIRASSCLIQPRPGDKVLICSQLEGPSYVLAVLERRAEGPLDMLVDTDIIIGSKRGSVTLQSNKNLELDSGQSIELKSPRLSAKFEFAQLVFTSLSYMGQVLDATLGKLKTTSHVIETIAERVQQTFKNSYKTVEESEFMKAGSIHHLASKLLNIRGRYSVITAKKDVKINGRHIHMG